MTTQRLTVQFPLADFKGTIRQNKVFTIQVYICGFVLNGNSFYILKKKLHQAKVPCQHSRYTWTRKFRTLQSIVFAKTKNLAKPFREGTARPKKLSRSKIRKQGFKPKF